MVEERTDGRKQVKDRSGTVRSRLFASRSLVCGIQLETAQALVEKLKWKEQNGNRQARRWKVQKQKQKQKQSKLKSDAAAAKESTLHGLKLP